MHGNGLRLPVMWMKSNDVLWVNEYLYKVIIWVWFN